MVAFSRLAVAAATLLSFTSAAPTAGDFDVVTINVAGLPALFNGNDVPGDKATNSRAIGTLLGRYGYDIVNMQEGLFPVPSLSCILAFTYCFLHPTILTDT